MSTSIDLSPILARLHGPVDLALILGSGLGAFADTFENAVAISTSELPGYPVSTVSGHAGKIITGTLSGKRVLAFQGRIHQYEGYAPGQVVLPVRIAHGLGANTLIVTNASGAFNKRFAPGDLLLIDDHINLQFRNPLRGPNHTGEARWPDMAECYDRELCVLAERIAAQQQIPLKRGTLGGLLGPTYETPAEATMLARLGADAGCMSTVPEVIAAAGLGMRVLGISCVTNWAAAISGLVLSHEEVQEVAGQASERFARLLHGILAAL
jgi:purine-nucleoside phosphorylase